MWQLFNSAGMPRRLTVARAGSILLRAIALLCMSFAAGFGFLAAIKHPPLRYNPHTFAVGAAGLFGAARGGLGLVGFPLRSFRAPTLGLSGRPGGPSRQNWEV